MRQADTANLLTRVGLEPCFGKTIGDKRFTRTEAEHQFATGFDNPRQLSDASRKVRPEIDGMHAIGAVELRIGKRQRINTGQVQAYRITKSISDKFVQTTIVAGIVEQFAAIRGEVFSRDHLSEIIDETGVYADEQETETLPTKMLEKATWVPVTRSNSTTASASGTSCIESLNACARTWLEAEALSRRKIIVRK